MFTVIKLAVTLFLILFPLGFAAYCIYTSFTNRFGTPFAERINLTNSNRAFIYSAASLVIMFIAMASMPLIETLEAEAIAKAEAQATQVALKKEAKAQGFKTIAEYQEWQAAQELEKQRRAEAYRAQVYAKMDKKCSGLECLPLGNGVRFYMPKELVEWVYPSCKGAWQPAHSKFFVGNPTTTAQTVESCELTAQQKRGEGLLSPTHSIKIALYNNEVSRIEIIEEEIPEKFRAVISENNFQRLGDKRFPGAYGSLISKKTATNKTLLELNYREGNASAICNTSENGSAVRLVFMKEDATLKTYAYQCKLLNNAEKEALEADKLQPKNTEESNKESQLF